MVLGDIKCSSQTAEPAWSAEADPSASEGEDLHEVQEVDENRTGRSQPEGQARLAPECLKAASGPQAPRPERGSGLQLKGDHGALREPET